MSIETYENQQSLLSLYAKLAEAESEIEDGDEGKDFFELAKKLRRNVYGKI
ncbi:hypothetical protein [Proteiniborus sp. MB09-C3]|uniref:hypothetical protein n=1 Tax=Proteiniborus sp. MB09-C3 TaxID=3050072 RepID=UPI0025549843|nr:hypothetical protein [Proteiniborus sp. MB09-C3]WIV10564.1 hypothetical protein QO263_10385 [Proteiniborus sp. MB09-C3]